MSTILHNNCNWQTKSCINRLSRIIVTDVCLWPLLMAICLLRSMCIYITARANTAISPSSSAWGDNDLYNIANDNPNSRLHILDTPRKSETTIVFVQTCSEREKDTMNETGLKGEKNLASRQGESLTRNCNALRLARPRAQSRDWTHVSKHSRTKFKDPTQHVGF